MNELIKVVQKHWHGWQGLAAGVALVAILAMASARYQLLSVGIAGLVAAVQCVLVLVLWMRARAIDRNPKDRIGVMVAIQCTDPTEQARVREDFVRRIRDLVMQGSATSRLNFVDVPDHLVQSLTTDEKVNALRRKANAHFTLYGHVRLRNFDGKQHHVIDIKGLVGHRELEASVQAQFRKEFSELLPNRIAFPEENDLLAFEFTAELADIIARYIIGLAAALSGDVDCAERLYGDISKRLQTVQKQFPVLEKIRARLPFRMFELHEARATAAYKKWRSDKSSANADELGKHLAAIPDGPEYSRRVLALRAIHAVVGPRNIALARQYTIRHNLPENATWHFNLAFLAAYEGRLNKAIRHYRDGARTVLDEETIADIEEFVGWIMRVEPSKYQFHYCLGFFNWKVREDLRLAADDFRAFLQAGDQTEFAAERKLARKWLGEIQAAIGAG